MNTVMITGRLGRKPETKILSSGNAVTNFRVAVARSFKDRNGNKLTDWFDVVCWNGTAEACAKYLDKGSLVGINGRLQERSWDKDDGTKGHIVEIVANEVEFLSKKNTKETEETQESEDWTDDFGGGLPF